MNKTFTENQTEASFLEILGATYILQHQGAIVAYQ